jgi:hypothetical protein
MNEIYDYVQVETKFLSVLLLATCFGFWENHRQAFKNASFLLFVYHNGMTSVNMCSSLRAVFMLPLLCMFYIDLVSETAKFLPESSYF